MGIIQENRSDFPQPEVNETKYGATYVKAATETPIVKEPVSEPSSSVSDEPSAEAARKRSGRPKKSNKK